MTKRTRSGTDNAQAARILAGLRERVSRLEKQDRYAEESAHDLRVTSESAMPDDQIDLEITTLSLTEGFGIEPFGTDFGSVTSEEGNDGVESTTTQREITNTTTYGFHEYVAEATQPSRNAPDPPATIAFGTGTGQFSPTNRDLHDEIGQIELIDDGLTNNGRTAVLNAQLDTNHFAGETLRELAVVCSDGRMINHAPLDPAIQKSDQMSISIEVRLQIVDR